MGVWVEGQEVLPRLQQGGGSIIIASDGSITYNVPTGETHDFQVNASTIFTISGSGVSFEQNIALGDDDELRFGAGIDYWFSYDLTNTRFRLRTTDSNGAGLDADVFRVEDGTDDVDFLGAVTLGSPLVVASGGTGLSTLTAAGRILRSTSATAVGALALGTARQLLQVNAGATDLEWASNIDIPGTLDVTGAGVFDSTVQVGGMLSPKANDGAALGSTSLSWSDLFLASGAVINFANGNVTLTHASGLLTLGAASPVLLQFNPTAGGVNSIGQSGGEFQVNVDTGNTIATSQFRVRIDNAIAFTVDANRNFKVGVNDPGVNATDSLVLAVGVGQTSFPGDVGTLFINDIGGVAGKAHWHMSSEVSSMTLIVPGVEVKTTTGDSADPFSGKILINEFDNNVKIYADGAYRTIASGW